MFSNGLNRVLGIADNRPIYKTASDTHTAVIAVQEQPKKVPHWCQETESEISPNKAQALWCILNNKAAGQAMPAVSFNGEVIERTNNYSRIPRDSLRQNADVHDAGRINKIQVQERTVHVESHGFKRHRITSRVPATSECDAQRH